MPDSRGKSLNQALAATFRPGRMWATVPRRAAGKKLKVEQVTVLALGIEIDLQPVADRLSRLIEDSRTERERRRLLHLIKAVKSAPNQLFVSQRVDEELQPNSATVTIDGDVQPIRLRPMICGRI